ncbi:hypothetical protein [Pseudobdellovibrio sp. HCB154]|uniref:hypothetical protein n=1 Tax=Pseudobdellovibrio sp. HCB154 TaxID=3386277 RepID=UPI0039171C7D
MKQLLLVLTIAVGFSGCGKLKKVLDKAETIPDKMDSLNTGMGETNASVRLQKLGIFEGMVLDQDHYEMLAPFPADLMTGGKFLGEALTTEEALMWVFKSIKKINTYDINSNPLLDAQDAKVQAKFDHDKLGLYMAVTIVSGYLRDSVIEEIVQRIYTSDRFTETGLQILALRAKFYSDVMLGGSLYTEKFATLGHVKEAIDYNSKIERIARLPYPQAIKVDIVGMLTPEMNEAMSVQFDPAIVNANWSKIKTLGEAGFEVKPLSGNNTADQAEAKRQRDVFNSYISFLNGKIEQAQSLN